MVQLPSFEASLVGSGGKGLLCDLQRGGTAAAKRVKTTDKVWTGLWKFQSTNCFLATTCTAGMDFTAMSTSCFLCQVDPPTWATRLISGWHKSVQVYEASHCPRW